MHIYQHDTIEKVRGYYGLELLEGTEFSNLLDYLSIIAKELWRGLQQQLPCLFSEINNYHPAHLGKDHSTLMQYEWTLTDSQHCIASEYGFKDWDELTLQCDVDRNHTFEDCVNTMLKGDLAGLRDALADAPELALQKSQFGHKATLLHYLASNGVELWRQVVPSNIVKIAHCLLEYGADKEANMQVYGGTFRAVELASTSAHLKEVSVLDEMIDILQ